MGFSRKKKPIHYRDFFLSRPPTWELILLFPLEFLCDNFLANNPIIKNLQEPCSVTDFQYDQV